MIDNRVHSMIIGRKGTGIRKIQKNMALKSNFQERVIQILTWSLLWVERKECLIGRIIFLTSKKNTFRMLLTRKCFKNMRNLLAAVQKNHSPRILTQMALKSSKEPHGKEQVTKLLFQHWVEEAMHRLFLPLPLHGDQSAKYLRQYDFNRVLTDEIKT